MPAFIAGSLRELHLIHFGRLGNQQWVGFYRGGSADTNGFMDSIGSAVKTNSGRYLSAKGLTEYLPLSKATIYAMVRKREIPFIPMGRKLIFDTHAVDAWLKRRSVGTVDSPGGG